MNRQEELEGLSDATLAELVARHTPQYHMTPEQFDKFNPCNNPNDIMPLVIENKIGFWYDHMQEKWCASNEEVDHHGQFTEFEVYQSNPYRAACIVLILSKETES